MASMYAVYHGAEGLAAIARRVNRLSTVLAAGLKSLGFAPLSTGFFDTVTVDAGDRAGSIIAAAAAAGVNLRRVDGSRIGISLDETTTPEIVEQVWAAFGGRPDAAALSPADSIPEALARPRAYLTHTVFNTHHSAKIGRAHV